MTGRGRGPGALLTRTLPAVLIAALALVLAASFLTPDGSFGLAEGEGLSAILRTAALGGFGVGALLIALALPRVLRSARSRASGGRPPAPGADDRHVDGPEATGRLVSAGWRVTRQTQDAVRLTRHGWSVWSGLLLHVGLLTVLIAGFVVFATESRGVIVLHEGEEVSAGTSLPDIGTGALARPPVMPGGLIGGRVSAGYWPSGEIRRIDAQHTDLESGESVRVAVNEVASWRGVRLFPSQVFGRAFYLRISGPDLSEQVLRIDVPTGPAIGEPGYRDVEIPAVPHLVRLKSIESRVPDGTVPTLTMRLDSDGTVVAEAVLSVEATTAVGPYEVFLEGHDTWQELYVVRQHGVPLLFAGIALVIAGSCALYLFPPSETWIVTDDGGWRLVVRPGRLAGPALRYAVETLAEGRDR